MKPITVTLYVGGKQEEKGWNGLLTKPMSG